MKKKLMIIQIIVLLGGTIFAWYNWVREYLAICQSCGSTQNPFLSPCFGGAITFSIALILASLIYCLEQKSKK